MFSMNLPSFNGSRSSTFIGVNMKLKIFPGLYLSPDISIFEEKSRGELTDFLDFILTK